jgi:hypothetical protein
VDAAVPLVGAAVQTVQVRDLLLALEGVKATGKVTDTPEVVATPCALAMRIDCRATGEGDGDGDGLGDGFGDGLGEGEGSGASTVPADGKSEKKSKSWSPDSATSLRKWIPLASLMPE